MRLHNDIFLDISLGVSPGKTSLFKYGASTVATDETVVWDGNNGYMGFLSTATQLDIVSTSALDTNGGLGAWNIIIMGLDSNFDEISELVLLNGLTTVTTAKSFLRVYRAFIINGGITAQSPIDGANQGDINIFTTGNNVEPDDLMAKIIEHKGQALMCIYTVKRGYSLYVTGISGGIGSARGLTLSYKARNAVTNGVFSTKYDLILYEASVNQNLKMPLKIPELTDIIVTGVASQTSPVTASFGGILIKNE